MVKCFFKYLFTSRYNSWVPMMVHTQKDAITHNAAGMYSMCAPLVKQ